MDNAENLSPLKRAIIEIRELRAQLDELQSVRTEPIAIIGMGLRIPGGANDAPGFWRLLRDGVDAITEVPPDRWDVDAYYDPNPNAPGKMTTRWGGFIDDVDKFDPQFFGISPREVMSMDPQHRVLIQVAWEALENAGQSPDKLADSDTGIFAGICSNDYFRIVFDDPTRLDTFSATGNVPSVAVGRLSYLLGLHGPNLAIDTACSSSLVAVHLAVQSLRRGDCHLAIAAGVNLILLPEININFSKSQMMAADGRCKTFDARADGYVRGEGCIAIVLKRLSDARKDGDRILALVRGTAINHDGKSSGLTAPNGVAQEAVIRAALADAQVAPDTVSYVETHGTGTSLGDPIEVRALGTAYRQQCTKALVIGSIKTNIGHLEAAAGLAGLAKTVLMLQHGEIPLHLHFKTPNPLIPWNEFPITVPTHLTQWADQKRLAGVSSFGLSGTNAHIILEQVPAELKTARSSIERPLHILTLSAKTENALRALVERYDRQLTNEPDAQLTDVAFTANTGRAHFIHRLALVAGSTQQTRTQLAAFLAGRDHVGVLRGRATMGAQPPIVFLFTGHGSHYLNMGRQLLETQPMFRRIIEQCDELLRPHLEHSLISVLYPTSETNLLEDLSYGQPAMFALEYALATLWRSWGIEPAAVAGHSIGEYVAACVAGVFSLEDAIKLVAVRGRLMQALPADGEMVTVFADEARVAPIIAPYAAYVSIAAINSPETIVISGHNGAMGKILSDLRTQKIKTRKLPIARAAHSPMVEPMLPAFAQADRGVKYSLPKIEIVSTVTGKIIGDEITQPEYWRRHLRQAVRFVDVMQTLATEGYHHWLEIGPNPALVSLGQRCVSDSESMRWLPSLRKGWMDWQVMLESLATLYIDGAPVNWDAFDRDYARQKVELPTYPFERKSYWWNERRGQPLGQSNHPVSWESILHAARQQASQAPLDLSLDTYAAKWDVLNRLTDVFVNNTMVELGAFARAGDSHSVDSLLAQFHILPTYHNLLTRWMNKLVVRGWLQQSGNTFVSTQALTTRTLDSLWNEAREKLADLPFVLDYISDCGNKLARIVTGKMSPLETLFPDGALNRAEALYQDWALARYYNHLVRAAVESAVLYKPARIIEIGAGTGATTSAVLPELDARASYFFTDVSDAFLIRAQAKFRAYPIVHYGLLNIEKDPHTQGFAQHHFDVVIAANVLHATRELGVTLQNILSLLAPDGVLVLYEATMHQSWYDITTGLIEGWQSFGDAVRADSPLLTAEQWKKLVLDAGFRDVVSLPECGSPAEILNQSVIIACAPSDVVAEQMPAIETPRVSVIEPTPTVDVIQQLQSALPDERRELLIRLVRGEVARILRMDVGDTFDRHQRLMDLGVDSLMAVELRSRLSNSLALKQVLPATLIFDYPTVEAIAEYLARDVLTFDQPEIPVTSAETHTGIENLSDEEIEAALLKKLKSL